MPLVIVNRRIGVNQINRYAFGKGMGQYAVIPDNKQIGDLRIASYPVVKEIL